MKPISAFNINFDSLTWCLNRGSAWRDPTYFEYADRFFAYSDKYAFKYSIFVIGQDLENPEIRSRIREWAQAGHEIGNHSFSHNPGLGILSKDKLEYEVLKTHEALTKVCGREPRGFIAPNWSTSSALTDVLIRAGYLYDTSVFPSYFMWLILGKLWINFLGDERQKTLLQRGDWAAHVLASPKPYFLKEGSLIRRHRAGFLMLPIPTTPFLRVPCWHTASFIYPEVMFNWALRTTLKAEYFYYLVHPTDLIDEADTSKAGIKVTNLERLAIPLGKKQQRFESSVRLIVEKSEKIVTLEQMAKSIISQEAAKERNSV